MIFLRDVALRRGAKLLFEHATASFFRGQKIGVTGANGVGKSSLFGLVRGVYHADSGDVEIQPDLVVAEVAQELPSGSRPAIEFALDGDAELRQVERELATAETEANGHRMAEAHEALERIGGYSARARAARLLSGLGFSDDDFERPLDAFSGGWRVRLNLSRALMCRSDLLLLDEPTNHLDLDAIVWLEQWLRGYPGTLLLISHDRDFLDNVVGSICHIEGGGMRVYNGNYSAFERQRAQVLSQQQAAFERQQREIAHMRSFVERFRAKATKARQAQSRLKALARMDEIAPAHVDSPFEFSFRAAAAHPDPALVLDEATAAYGTRTVLEDVRLSLSAGSRIGLLGRNGAGKSTLVKLLSGELAPAAGQRTEGKGLAIGYFAQRQLDQLRPDDSPLGHLMRIDPRVREQELRDFLGGFDFRGDNALAQVGRFSGGEKSRLALALIAWQRPNVLLLDEPTNHLDIEMRLALTQALQDYDGAMVLVSHDRSLLRAACDQLYLVEGGRVREFDGDLDDYTRHLASGGGGEAQAPQGGGQSRKAQRRIEAEARAQASNRRKPVESELRKLETEMQRLGVEKERLEKRMAAPDLYDDARKDDLKQCLQEQARIARRLAEAEERWLALSAELEALAGG
jgi:ATP-binding cassette, subfamily F, member 3